MISHLEEIKDFKELIYNYSIFDDSSIKRELYSDLYNDLDSYYKRLKDIELKEIRINNLNSRLKMLSLQKGDKNDK